MDNLEFIKFKQSKHIATIIFNRPEKYNSIVKPMAQSLLRALTHCEDDTSIRAIVLKGEGKAFCAGQDLNETMNTSDFSASISLDDYYNPIILKIREMEKPIVAAVNGVAAGAGASIALASDICIATKSAVFVQAFSNIGLVPDCGSTFLLPRYVGFQKASALMMLGEKVSAIEAEQMGMIYKFLEDDEFEQYTMELLNKLVQMPTKALGLIKRALNQSATNNIKLQLALEDLLQSQALQTLDFKEGVDAFLKKRKPVFQGR